MRPHWFAPWTLALALLAQPSGGRDANVFNYWKPVRGGGGEVGVGGKGGGLGWLVDDGSSGSLREESFQINLHGGQSVMRQGQAQPSWRAPSTMRLRGGGRTPGRDLRRQSTLTGYGMGSQRAVYEGKAVKKKRRKWWQYTFEPRAVKLEPKLHAVDG